MMKVQKVYVMFDTAYLNEEDTKELVQDWGHKEPLRVRYLAINEEDLQDLFTYKSLPLESARCFSFPTFEEAEDMAREEEEANA